MKKLVALIVFFILLVLLFVVALYIPKNYKYQYRVGEYQIVEQYSKKQKSYFFTVTGDDVTGKYALLSKYYRKRGLISHIDSQDNCLYISSKTISNFDICQNEDGYVTKYYNQEVQGSIIDTYDNINIYKSLDHKMLIWNYDSFVYVNGSNIKNISLFDDDVYELKLLTKIDHYLIVADYNQKYYFEKLYRIDIKNGAVKEIKLNRKVYFDAYILGTYKNNIYLFDNNKDIEYIINPMKGTIDKYSKSILVNGKWETVTLNKLKKREVAFINTEDYYFNVIDGLLYYITPINEVLVTNQEVSRIVESNTHEVFYIADDSLYYVNYKDGISIVMSYTEWQFNNSNIYIF